MKDMETKNLTSRKRKQAPKTTKAKKSKEEFKIPQPQLSSSVGKVFVLGDNSVGQLGFNDDIEDKKRPALLEMPFSIVDIVAGGMHSVCLTEAGEVITFGCNDEGALGRVTEDGSEYIPEIVNIPEKIVQISAGDSHTAALSESGKVYIWGNFRNNNGVMGLVHPDKKEILPVQILTEVKIVKISSGNDHLCCISDTGNVYTCGNGESGQLGRISERTASNGGGRQGISVLLHPEPIHIRRTKSTVHITDIWTGSLSTFMKLNNGSVLAFGLNNYGQLGLNPDKQFVWQPRLIDSFKNRNWQQIDADMHHTLALDNNGLVYSIGRSDDGRLGLGENCQDTSQPTENPTLQNKKCTLVSCGNSTSFALEDNGSVYSWGFGTNYQLGHGNDNDQHIPKLIEGNFYNNWKALKVSSGGQHTLILAHPKSTK